MKSPSDRSGLKLVALAGAIVIAVIIDVVIVYFAFRHFWACRSDSAICMLLIWSVCWLGPNALLAFFIFKLLKYQHSLLAQAICLAAVTVNLILIFSMSPMDLFGRSPKGFESNPQGVAPDSTAAKFLIEENKKAVEEIKDRMAQEDTWFHNKFILVGGLLAATLGYIGFAKEGQSAEERLMTLSKSSSTAVILALASVLALGIDMHVRGNASETRQIGLWIRYYVEPVLLHGDPTNASKPLPGDFYGWEEFLRAGGPGPTAMKTVDWHTSTGGGKHSGELWNLFYAPHIHFLTALVYILYLAAFQTFASPTGSGRGFGRRGIPIICFAVVQASFFAFAWIAHSAPEIFELKVLPFMPAYEVGYVAPLHYFTPCLALVFLNIPYIAYYWRNGSNQAEAKQPTTQTELG